MRKRFSELALGARFAITGGSDARLRAALTAVGVGLGVMMLLLAASAPHMIHAHNQRVQGRVSNIGPGHARLYELPDSTVFHGQSITVQTLQAIAARPPLPPGIERIPGPGEMYVSPALNGELHSSLGKELATRLGARVVGVIAQQGLSGPAELYAYRGGTDLAARNAEAITSFSEPPGSGGVTTLFTLLVIVMVIALLLPVGVFVATASHFGAEQRNERLAAVRLLGADRSSTARIAAGESLLGALAGVLLGALGFVLIVRTLLPHVQIEGISVYGSDVDPSVWLTLLVIILVPATSVLFTLVSLRQVAIEPLGVTRHGRPARRRVAWRLITPIVGLLLLLPLIGHGSRLEGTAGTAEASAGIVLMLIGVCALLPWLVEAVVTRAGAGSVSWMLAVRRLRVDHGTSGRVVSAVALTVAGAIALQTLFVAAQDRQDSSTASSRSVSSGQTLWQTAYLHDDSSDVTQSATQSLMRIPAVAAAAGTAYASQVAALDLSVAPCATLVRLFPTQRCGNDSVLIAKQEYSTPKPGEVVRINGRRFVIPKAARVLPLRSSAQQSGISSTWAEYEQDTLAGGSVYLTPAAAARLGLHPHNVTVSVRLKSDVPDADDAFRDAVARIDPLAAVTSLSDSTGDSDQTYDHLKRILVAGAAAVLLVIGASLLVSVAEQLRERRRVLAVLSAFGAKRSTLGWSVVWQTLVPVGIGLLLAIGLGIALATVLMRIVSVPVRFDWGAIAILVGVGAGVIAAVTALTLPLLWRQMRPEALRAE